jgi:phosphatidylserine/phosphatidylglycerophosphate/cardiolipin synthase-like enzyme
MKRRVGLALALLCLFSALAPIDRAIAQEWAVYFSPRGGCTQAIVSAVGRARTSLHIQAYSFTSYPILRAVIAAQARGVQVAVILDQGLQQEDRYSAQTLRYLQAAGVPAWIDGAHQNAHNKIMIIDGETVITGSFNFTRSAEEYNAENLLVIRDKALASRYEANFQEHLQHSWPAAKAR